MSVVARPTAEIDVIDKQNTLLTTLLDNLGIALSGLALIASAIAVIYCLILAVRWYTQPFPGFIASSDLTITDTQPLNAGTLDFWPGLKAGLQTGDHILRLGHLDSAGNFVSEVDFQNQANAPMLLNNTLQQHQQSQQITLEIFRSGVSADSLPQGCLAGNNSGAVCHFTFPVIQTPILDFLAMFGVDFVLAIILIVMGATLWTLRRRQSTARVVATICAAGAYIIAGRFDLFTTYSSVGILIWAFAMCVLAGGLAELAFTFPFQPLFVRRTPAIRYLIPILAALMFIACWNLYQPTDTHSYDSIQLITTVVVAVMVGLLLISLYSRRRRSVSPMTRDQAGVALVGLFVAIAPALIWIAMLAGQQLWGLASLTLSSVFIFPPMLIFPLALAYSLLQYRTLNSDRVISEGMIYFILGALLVIGYLLLTLAAYQLSNGVFQFNNPIIIAVTLFVISVAFTPLRLRMEKLVSQAFFRQPRLYEQRMEQFSRAMPTTVEVDAVVGKLKMLLFETLSPQYIFIFLRNFSANDYEAYPDLGTGKAPTDIRFDADSPLVRLLDSTTDLLYLGPGEAPPPELSSDRSRLAVLHTPVIVRMRSASRLNGFFALGPRANNSAYRYEDLRFLEGVSAQAAAAFERAQVIIEAQRNERELKVLAQVSASLNIAMDFDTLLEFIYTQVDKIISAPNFYIALRDTNNDEMYFAFYQEAGERLPDKEGLRWSLGRDLISEVVRTQQPLRTENYVQETLRRDNRLHIENTALRAWMGVPLNAGNSGALGCLAIATTDPNVTYSADQMRIFGNIADLAATAIYKTRLFSETEKRARQMKILNDISSKLASEFENLDALLKIIIESAVEILFSEAGSLLLRDEATNDLIFQLAVGGSGQDLVGTRIPAGSGIAGTVVNTAKHVIVNDANQDRRWFGEVRREEGKVESRKFATRSILAVPLSARGGVIGVLEVINKLDGTSFVEEDVNLLTTFAGQAAVAIENARLFQMTDLALSERVQQLDTMQRIDQELNRTLDLRRVVELTIENARKESGADAGALALVEIDPPGFVIQGSIGYPEGILKPGTTYPITLGILGKVYRTGQLSLISSDEMGSDHDYIETLPDAKAQLAVPLVTGENVSGILLLETAKPEAFNMMTASFIQGLAEHANTAITNSQLFTRLEEANKARTQFVGFVAHELKNPMASIKGYAEVLLGGMSGQLSEQQQNFIAVIRRNVVRMQTLVDDLRDLTAQETGNLALNLAPISFNNVIIETLRPQQRAIDEKQQKVVQNVPENLALVWGDELRLIQVMTNFVSNANKYTPENGTITILAEDVPNIWDEQGPPRVIHCAVSDTGIGMNEEDLKKLFTPYWRSENPKTREQQGTGLGMTLTRGLVEAHHGKVWVESTIEVGTTFHFTVPLAEEMEKAAVKR